MDTYPCPACGGAATEADGCPSCGRAHDPVAAALARLNQAMAGLEDESRALAENQHDLRARRARLQSQRAALTRALALRLAEETAPGATRTGRRTAPTQRTTVRTMPAPRPGPVDLDVVGAETSPRQAQNTLLTLGGILLGIAAVVIAGVFYTTTQTGGRAFILGVATTLCLGVPVLLARNTLTATAETIASIGLLLLLLDGYTAYSANLAGVAVVPGPLYAAIIFALTAGVAAAYRLATHLRAPQFAALLALQPLLPLIAVHLDFGRTGFAAVFAIVAGFNLSAVYLFGIELRVLAAGRLRRAARRGGEAPSDDGGMGWPRMLRELAWFLFGLCLAAATGLAAAELVRADTVATAVRATLALMLAAAAGVAGGQLSGRHTMRHIATGAATLAIIGAVSRVDALALPDYTLVLTAALAAAIAVGASLLPADVQRGPQLGSLVGAVFAAIIVVVSTVGTVAATVRAAITPEVWAADVAAFAGRVQTTNWQVPAAAVLLAVLAAVAVPASWRLNAVVLGAAIVVFAAPGTGELSWWAVPLVGVVASTFATAMALIATDGRGALVRSSTAGVLGLYAVATSLARPELTAGVCAILALVAAATAVLTAGWPERFGPYADRVADSAGGAAAFTLPIAVGTFAWLGGAESGVLLPLTLLATSVGVLGAALSQVAARVPRTASAGGALVAAAGCVFLSIRMDGSELADVGLAVLLLAAAIATAASRAFEVAPGGLVDGVTAVPDAVDALVDSIDGRVDRPEPPRRRWPSVDGTTLGAALATAGLIFALARLLAVAAPGVGLVTTMAMVLLMSLGVRAMPESWRRGPRLGGLAVGGAIGVVSAGIAVTEAARAIAAGLPPWGGADLATWTERVSGWAPYGWQVPASLLLAAAAAWALLPAPVGADLGFVTLSLAGLAIPAAAGLAWWSPIVIALLLAVAAGLGAALVPAPARGALVEPDAEVETVARRRLGLAAVLGLYAAAASAPTPGATGALLSGIVAAGVIVATVGHLRGVPPIVPGVATGSALLAAPGAAATLAAASGSTRTGVLGSALGVAAFGILIVWALRAAGVRWRAAPALGVGAASLVVGLAALPDLRAAQIWAAAGALVAVAAAASTRTRREATAVIVATALPGAILGAVASAPAWLTALVGPYRTLRQVWQGYAVAPVPEGAGPAMATLALLAAFAAAMALTLGGRRYVQAAVLPPLAALALVAPTALDAPREATAWVALGVALATGLGAALSPPTLPSAARLLRGTAGMVCALAGGAGFAGALATRTDTMLALAVILGGAGLAAALGRDPAVRMVAWMVASAAAFALPVTALAAAGSPVRSAAFGVLVICAGLTAGSWVLARAPARRVEAGVVELCASIGATLALLLTLSSTRHAAAVLTIWGLLLGAAALRRDRSAQRRQWLVRAALVAELGASWMLLYSVEVGLPEAYTLPFAAVALLAGALELRRRPDLSSWIAYGPALVGGFGPSLVLVVIGDDTIWRWVTLFAATVATVILGSWRRRRAPVVAGSVVAVAVALIEMIRLLARGAVAGAILVAVAGVVLIIFGALSEKRLRGALRKMS